MKSVKVGLIGYGTIGSGVYKLLKKNGALIKERTGIDISIKTICDIRLDELKKNVKDAVINKGLLDRISRPEGASGLMPNGGPRLPQATIDLIVQWDADGLLEN